MSVRCRVIVLALSFGLTAACAATDEPVRPAITATATATTANTTTTTTTTTTATTTTTTTVVEREPLVLEESTTVTSIGVFGDSLVADLTAVGGRNNQVVPQIAALLIGDEDLAVERVENLAVPGQSVVADLGLLSTDKATIRPYVDQTLRERPEPLDLAMVAISSSDINLNATLPDPIPPVRLAQQMLAELSAVEASFRAAGVEVVFLPIFGINDTVFSDLRCALAPTCPDGPDAQIDIINDVFWDSDLPMLFERFEQLDRDGDGRTDRAWFVDVDARYPDDGVHPNADGQAIYSTTVARALEALLS
ncbi:MAG: SGNH/GDSL hydrolase family protein [Ilumatobacter sp.]|uniref:hypothetical protein n=1 Tax=Ilumatobacter sp. TaxID=1967498 RepID=UPI003C76F85E